MLYNKNEASKVNDKKVLHKVGKNWKVVSIALLMAIGGTAVATHTNASANADTTNGTQITSNASNNLGATNQSASSNATNANAQISPQTEKTIQSLEADPKVQAPVSVSASSDNSNVTSSSAVNSSATNSNGTVSANAPKSAPASSISYESGDNGSAASYHAKAVSDSSAITANSSKVSNYVQSLNSRLPKATGQLNKNYSAEATKASTDQSLATSYANIANQSNYSAKVSTMASSAGLTTSEYTDYVEFQTNNYSNEVSEGQSNVNKLQSAKSLVISAYNVKHNSSASYNAQVSLAYASANYSIAKANSSATDNMLSALNNEQNNYYSASASFEMEKFNENTALSNSAIDASTVNSLATDFGLANSTATSSAVSAYAQKSVASSGFISLNSKAVSYNVQSNINANIYQLLSDTYTMNHFAESIPSMVDERSLSNAINSEVAVASDDAINVSEASAEFKDAQDVANGYLDLSNLGGFDPDTVANLANLAQYGANDTSAVSAVDSEIMSAQQSLDGIESQAKAYASSTDNEYAVAKDYASLYQSKAKADQTALTQAKDALEQFQKAYAPTDVAKAMDALAKAKTDLPNSSALAEAFGMHVYNYGPKYVNVIKNLMVHTSTNYTKDNAIMKVPAGSALRVLGVGFDQTGRLRYRVSINGKTGFITGKSDYTRGTYLFAGKKVNVTVNQRGIREYKDATFATPVKKLAEGTQLTGTVISEPDNNFDNKAVYGAFTRIKLDNGDFITANTNFFSNVSTVQPASNKGNNNQSTVIFG